MVFNPARKSHKIRAFKLQKDTKICRITDINKSLNENNENVNTKKQDKYLNKRILFDLKTDR